MRRHGYAFIEMIVAVIAILIIFAVLMVINSSPRDKDHRQLKDTTQLRGIHSALTIWAGNNDDKYPLPSMIDVDNTTVAELGSAKDTTGNIISILLNGGFVSAEMLVNPSENNDRISEYWEYEVEQPQAAIDPDTALWDPAFSADFTAEGGGHTSYAHLLPQGPRLDQWSNTFKSDEAILSNRGPEMASVERVDGNVITKFAIPQSLTTLLHSASKNAWTGNIAYNDNHVKFVNNLYTHNENTGSGSTHRPISLANDDGTTTDYHDVLFADEEEAEGNLFLGIFTTAGENKEDFTAIWD